MKSIKFIILSLALMLGFIMQCEVFQTQLWCFDKADYKVSTYNVSPEQKQEFLEELSETAKKNGVSIFATFMSMETDYEMVLHIYGNEQEIRKTLAKISRVEERTYHSLFNGITDVRFHSFAEFSDLEYGENFISYIGEDEKVQKVYEEMSAKYDLSYPDFFEATENDWISTVWVLIVLLVIVMNCVEVIRRKKEVVIRISQGEGVGRIIGKAILTDILLYGIAYFVTRKFVFCFMSGEYNPKLALTIYIIGCLLSVMLYFAFAFYDIRKAFSNVNDAAGVLYLMYGLKCVVTVLTIFTLVTNLDNLYDTFFGSNEQVVMSQYEDYSYFRLIDLGGFDEDEWEQREQFYETVWNDIYESDIDKLNPVVCANVLEDETDYIFLNKNAEAMLQGFSEMLTPELEKADVIVFVPKSLETEAIKEDVKDGLCGFMENDFTETDFNTLDIQYVPYNKRQKYAYFSDNSALGVETTVNPLLIYANSENIELNGANTVNYAGNYIMYDMTDQELKDLEEKYKFSENGFEVVRTNVKAAYEYRRSFVVRLISFLSSLCVVVLILQIILILTINALEYRIHALELSLKKVLGYGLWSKNKKIILCSAGIDVFATVVLCVAEIFVNLINIRLCIVVGLALACIELFVIGWNVFWLEKENVHKALKGGCL